MKCQHCGVNEAYTTPIPAPHDHAGEFWCGPCVRAETARMQAVATQNNHLARRARRINRVSLNVTNAPWSRKPGRIVPPILMAGAFLITAVLAGPGGLFWWFFLVPVMVWFWQWGIPNPRPVQRGAPTMPTSSSNPNQPSSNPMQPFQQRVYGDTPNPMQPFQDRQY
jgi:hypothetical protein